MEAWISLPARLASVELARQWLLQRLQGVPVPAPAIYRIELVLEELLMNVVTHGHPGERSAGFSLRLGADVVGDLLTLCVEDDGVPFDPGQATLPQPPTSLADARVGGLGLVLVHKSARSLRHERVDGLNRLWVELPLTAAAARS